MMTPTLEALARQLAADPRWRWLPGTCWIQCPPGDPEEWTDRGRLDGYNPEHMACPADAIPDLSDPVTAAALLVLAREVSGCPRMAVGTVNERWMVFQSLAHYYRWREGYGQTPPPLTGVDDDNDVLDYATEIEALAAVILRGGE